MLYLILRDYSRFGTDQSDVIISILYVIYQILRELVPDLMSFFPISTWMHHDRKQTGSDRKSERNL